MSAEKVTGYCLRVVMDKYVHVELRDLTPQVHIDTSKRRQVVITAERTVGQYDALAMEILQILTQIQIKPATVDIHRISDQPTLGHTILFNATKHLLKYRSGGRYSKKTILSTPGIKMTLELLNLK